MNKPVMRYHGAKFRLAPWVQSFFPAHTCYVEPFAGAAGVLMQKPRSYAEVYNDIDDDIVNVFRVLQCPNQSQQLSKKIALTPYARREFEKAYKHTNNPIEKARRTIVRAQMGFGSAGATKGKTGFRIDSGRDYHTAADLWSAYPKTIQLFCDRLQGVIIESRPAIQVINDHDRADTLFFVDPPYLHSTRCMGGNRNYNHEMSDQDHIDLIETLKQAKGMVVLSGYDNKIYQHHLSSWEKHEKKARISSGRGTGIKIETIWLNPACAKQQPQPQLFTS